MLFAEFLDEAISWANAHLPIVIGASVTLVLIVFLVLPRSRGPRPSATGLDPSKFVTPAGVQNAVLADKAAQWAPPEQSYADRRGAVRREGPPVRIYLASTMFKNGMTEGYVLDRSTGGLRVAMSVAVSVGMKLQVRAANAPEGVGFVVLLVRSCRPNEDWFEVGCEFEVTPPWNVLLLFG